MGDAMPGEHAIHGLETDGESSDVLEHARMLDQSCIWMIIKLTEQLGFMCAGHTARLSWRGEVVLQEILQAALRAFADEVSVDQGVA